MDSGITGRKIEGSGQWHLGRATWELKNLK